jgi:hypothetical protein
MSAQTLAFSRDPNVAEAHGPVERAGSSALLVDHQVLGADHGAVGHDGGSIDDVLQLSHVAGPPVSAEHGERVETDLAARLAADALILRKEVIRDQPHVVVALAERGQLDAKHGETCGKIVAERTC